MHSFLSFPLPCLTAFCLTLLTLPRHIDSYNFFVEHEIKEIVRANRTIRSDVDSNFWLEYVRIGFLTDIFFLANPIL